MLPKTLPHQNNAPEQQINAGGIPILDLPILKSYVTKSSQYCQNQTCRSVNRREDAEKILGKLTHVIFDMD